MPSLTPLAVLTKGAWGTPFGTRPDGGPVDSGPAKLESSLCLQPGAPSGTVKDEQTGPANLTVRPFGELLAAPGEEP
jgi:hypothetical protein